MSLFLNGPGVLMSKKFESQSIKFQKLSYNDLIMSECIVQITPTEVTASIHQNITRLNH